MFKSLTEQVWIWSYAKQVLKTELENIISFLDYFKNELSVITYYLYSSKLAEVCENTWLLDKWLKWGPHWTLKH